MPETFGYVSPQSTNKLINFLAAEQENNLLSVVGKMMYFDTRVEGYLYRAIGTVTEITTQNSLFNNSFNSVVAQGRYTQEVSKDLRTSSFVTQAVFVKEEGDTQWKQSGAVLPTSPSTNSVVHLLDEAVLHEMTDGLELPSIGTFRGLNIPLPINTPDFGGNRGAYHSAVLGKSGSGKRLDVNTPIPTPAGWTTMGELKDGDSVFNEKGEAITVTKAHPIVNETDSYEVVFSDGSTILADAEHLWYTETVASRRSTAAGKFRVVDRKPLLNANITTELRNLASKVSTTETLRTDEFIKLFELPISVDVVDKMMKDFISSGTAKKVIINRMQPASSRVRMVTHYNKNEILSSSLEQSSQLLQLRSNKALTSKLSSILQTAQAEETVTFSEYADLLNINPRNGNLRRFVASLGASTLSKPTIQLLPAVEHKTYSSHGKSVYRLVDLLTTVADKASHFLNDQQDKLVMGSVKTTQEIKDTLLSPTLGNHFNHSIPMASAIQYPEKNVSIAPYVLGAWLGDGKSSSGVIFSADAEMKSLLTESPSTVITGEHIKKMDDRLDLFTWRVEGLTKKLRTANLLENKHIPAEYLTTSIAQRRELLAGLLDTDGNATPSSSIEFGNTNYQLAKDVHELACSLGYRATITEGEAKLYGRFISKKWTVRFSTNESVFKLARKAAHHSESSSRYNASKNNQRYIVAVNKIADIPMRCITVDGDSALYLAGKSFIPTHNTAGYTYILSTYMRHEQHAIVVVDPQGQWSNENGFIFSPQRFAESLGREVKLIRIAEEVRLPKDVDLLSRLIDQMKAWTRLRRMGSENQAIFSQEVAERIMRGGKAKGKGKAFTLDDDARVILTEVFLSIARSQAAMRRIYADDKIRDIFKEELYALAGEIPDDVDTDSDDYEGPNDEELEDVESSWDSILKVFRPLLNLFSSKNLAGEKRHSLAGEHGVLSDIFQVRKEGSKPAPYVVIDMSPNVRLHAKRALNKDDIESYMATMLDKEAVKALILQVLFTEIKKASEVVFAETGGNLNTQIVFDEAWRYAPEGKAIPEIEELANMLEGFAFDTRKFGIGWTYILQSPSDLKRGIWSQLTYIYAAYGLVGNDIKVLEERYSDLSQTEIYKGFISPASTGIYPLMIVGSISPLIFTNAPTFLNMFTDAEQFLEGNKAWVSRITTSRGLPRVTVATVDPLQTKTKRPSVIHRPDEVEVKSYKVAKNYDSSEPQTKRNAPTSAAAIEEDDLDTPF